MQHWRSYEELDSRSKLTHKSNGGTEDQNTSETDVAEYMTMNLKKERTAYLLHAISQYPVAKRRNKTAPKRPKALHPSNK